MKKDSDQSKDVTRALVKKFQSLNENLHPPENLEKLIFLKLKIKENGLSELFHVPHTFTKN